MNKPKKVTENDWKLLKEKYHDLDKAVKLINEDYPIQYLIGNVNFYGYEIKVNKNVLIPRFETEGLIEKTIKLLNDNYMDNIQVLDIGTGSGVIPIVLKKEMPDLHITSIDISNKALNVAKSNTRRYHLKDITYIHKSIFKFNPLNRYSLLISNPPYVDKSEEVGPEIKYEPQNAIFAEDNGLEFYKFIINNSHKYLKKEFIMAFEIGCNQAKQIKELALSKYPKAKVIIEKDLAGFNRYVFIINKNIK